MSIRAVSKIGRPGRPAMRRLAPMSGFAVSVKNLASSVWIAQIAVFIRSLTKWSAGTFRGGMFRGASLSSACMRCYWTRPVSSWRWTSTVKAGSGMRKLFSKPANDSMCPPHWSVRGPATAVMSGSFLKKPFLPVSRASWDHTFSRRNGISSRNRVAFL